MESSRKMRTTPRRSSTKNTFPSPSPSPSLHNPMKMRPFFQAFPMFQTHRNSSHHTNINIPYEPLNIRHNSVRKGEENNHPRNDSTLKTNLLQSIQQSKEFLHLLDDRIRKKKQWNNSSQWTTSRHGKARRASPPPPSPLLTNTIHTEKEQSLLDLLSDETITYLPVQTLQSDNKEEDGPTPLPTIPQGRISLLDLLNTTEPQTPHMIPTLEKEMNPILSSSPFPLTREEKENHDCHTIHKQVTNVHDTSIVTQPHFDTSDSSIPSILRKGRSLIQRIMKENYDWKKRPISSFSSKHISPSNPSTDCDTEGKIPNTRRHNMEDHDDHQDPTFFSSIPSLSVQDSLLPLFFSNPQVSFTTDEFNLILLFLSLSDDTHKAESMLVLFQIMMEHGNMGILTSSPNADTYLILMFTFYYKSHNTLAVASKIASMMIQDEGRQQREQESLQDQKQKSLQEQQEQLQLPMVQTMKITNQNNGYNVTKHDDTEYNINRILNPDTVSLAMQIFSSRLDRKNAELLFERILVHKKKKAWRISCRDLQCLLSMYKVENLKEQALQLIQWSMEEARVTKHHDPMLTSFLLSCTDWPKKNKTNLKLSNVMYYHQIMDLFQTFTYSPAFVVWKKLLLQGYSIAQSESRTENWNLLQRTCYNIVQYKDKYTPNHQILKISLEVAEATEDPELAAALLMWAQQGRQMLPWLSDDQKNEDDPLLSDSLETSTGTADVNPGREVYIPPEALVRSVHLCIQHDRVDLASQIIDKLPKTDCSVSKTLQRELLTMLLSGYAKLGQIDNAERILQEMRSQNMLLSDKPYAAYIQALSEGDNWSSAVQVLDNMMENYYGDNIKPTSACYTSCMMSALKYAHFEDVLKLNERMMSFGIPPDLMTFQVVIHACCHLEIRKKERLITEIESAVRNHIPMNWSNVSVCITQMLPMIPDAHSIENVRTWLRKISDDRTDVRIEAISLVRSLRLAEIENNRVSSKMKTSDEIDSLRENLWRQVMKDMIVLCRKMELDSSAVLDDEAKISVEKV